MKKILTTLMIGLVFVSTIASAQLDNYKKYIVGKWQSLDDPKSMEIFDNKKNAISEYGGKKIETLRYNISYYEVGKGYILSKSDNSDADATVYTIIKLSSDFMELSMLNGRGNTLRYKKIGGNANTVTTGKLMTVAVAKSYFYTQPDAKTIRRAYLLKDQQVSVWKEQNGFINATYVNDKGTKTSGWLKRADLK